MTGILWGFRIVSRGLPLGDSPVLAFRPALIGSRREAAEFVRQKALQIGSRIAERITPAVAPKTNPRLPVGFGRAVSLHVPPRIGRKVAIHFAPEIRSEAAVKTGFGLPPDIAPRTVLGTVRGPIRRASVWVSFAAPNTACFGHLGQFWLA